MPLNKTNLILSGAPLPPDFRGTPQQLFAEMVRRLTILSPVGTNFFVVGDVEPSSDVGPWLKNGTQWWVFSAEEGRYVPADISASETPFAVIGPTEPEAPGDGDPLLWLRTAQDRVAGLYGWTGTEWRASSDIINSGPTASRPTVPVDLEQYFDTDINVQLRFERGAWRTAAGSPGDVKMVTHLTLEAALTINPGWEVLGKDDESQRGRLLGMAAKDTGATPATSLTTISGITPRAAGEEAGSEEHTLASDEIEQHTHLMGHATALNSDNNAQFHRVDSGDDVSIPAEIPPNYFQVNGEGGGNGTHAGTAGNGPTGTALITSRQLSKAEKPAYTGDAEPHNNLPQTLFLWTLVKT